MVIQINMVHTLIIATRKSKQNLSSILTCTAENVLLHTLNNLKIFNLVLSTLCDLMVYGT